MTKSLQQLNEERKQERIDNDEGNIGIITEERMKENKKEQGYTTYELFKIFNKLEQRIATLEKVLASHAKCIGQLREDNNDI